MLIVLASGTFLTVVRIVAFVAQMPALDYQHKVAARVDRGPPQVDTSTGTIRSLADQYLEFVKLIQRRRVLDTLATGRGRIG